MLKKNIWHISICLLIIISISLLQPCKVQAGLFDWIADKIEKALDIDIPFLAITVEFVPHKDYPDEGQPKCADGAKWQFLGTDPTNPLPNSNEICGDSERDSYKLNTTELTASSFFLKIIEDIINFILDTVESIIGILFKIIIPNVDFNHPYNIVFGNVDGWEKPDTISDYVTLLSFKPTGNKDTNKGYHRINFWPIEGVQIPTQFGMYHKVSYKPKQLKCFLDADGDTYGDPERSQDTIIECPSGWVENDRDCDDTDSTIHPREVGEPSEQRCNNMDDDCDGFIDEGLKDVCYYDVDGDGFGDTKNSQIYCRSDGPPPGCVDDSTINDCDDSNPDRYPENPASECDDGVDHNCNSHPDIETCAGGDCLAISDIPLETLASPPPPLIMFVIDDSKSMDQDIMTEETNGDYYVGAIDKNFFYVLDTPDNIMEQAQNYPSNHDLEYFLSQWHDYNHVYYNPNVTYDPWPRWETLTAVAPDWPEVPNASPLRPRSNPMTNQLYTLDWSEYCIPAVGECVMRTHYFVYSLAANNFYLVNLMPMERKINYYLAEIIHGNKIKTIQKVDPPPADVLSTRTFDEEKQNFANWFSFYRRRMHTVKAVLGKVITSIEGVKVGLLTLNNNNSVRSPVLPVKCQNSSGVMEDETDNILKLVYSITPEGDTPLRQALEKAGKYFDENTSSEIGEWPFASSNDGGECQQVFTVMVTDGFWNGSDPSVGNADQNSNACFEDNHTNTLADVAMQYYENDLSPSLEDKVFSRTGDFNSQQHMVTFSVAFGINGTLNPLDYPNCPTDAEADCSGTCPDWPKPKAGEPSTVDDLWHAAVNGRGQYFSVNNPQSLVYAIKAAVRQTSIIDNTASVAVNGQSVNSDTLLFQGSFNSNDWSGDLKAYAGVASGEIDYDDPVWSASDLLDAQVWNTRKIYTKGNGSNFFKDISGELLALINPDVSLATRIVEYIIGDDKDELKNAGVARNRSHKLGDIVHSQPLLFHNNQYIFVGANDGMAHIFKADTGEEAAAYVPNLVFKNLINLCLPEYTHKFFCDATPTIKVVNGNTYIVSGLGKGGRGYFCLKTVAGINLEIVPQWEYPSALEPENTRMGYSYSTPYIVDSNANAKIVIFGNGYASKDGKAYLFILDFETGSEIVAIDTTVGDSDICNGLSTPALIDYNFDGKVDYAYAGDMIGNLWKFDLTSDNSNEWHIAYGTNDAPKPLFQATSIGSGATTNPQPITSKPDIMSHCVHGKNGFIIVFATGRYLTKGDTASLGQQTIYGIWDWQDEIHNNEYYYGSFTNDRTLSNAKDLGASNEYEHIRLLKQEIEQDYNSDKYGVITDKTISWYPDKNESNISHVGWYFDLPTPYERVIDNPIIREAKVIVVSYIPSASNCGVSNRSNMYILNACNGGRLNDPIIEVNDEIVKVDPDNPANPSLPPSIIILDTVIKPPAFLHTAEGTDEMIFGQGPNTSIPKIEIDSEQGRYYWKN